MASIMNVKRPQKGFSVIELAVAMTVLSLGSAVLWYGIKSAGRLDRLNRLHHSALMAARSDMEALRLVPKENIHDTLYSIPSMGQESLFLVRQVFDSTRIMSSLEDIVLDEKLSPQELRKPLEVKVSVLLVQGEAEGGGLPMLESQSFPWTDDADKSNSDGRTIVSLILKIPEYRWY
jgi:prepilin-type N-terminal cleavage/methylation domain-containing protein